MDDVLFPFTPGYARWLAEAGLPSFDPCTVRCPDSAAISGLPLEAALSQEAAFVASRLGQSLAPMPGAQSALASLRQVVDIHVVTARTRPAFDIATHRWLDRHLPDLISGVHYIHEAFTAVGRPKASVCLQLGAALLVDDSVAHLQGLLNTAVTPVLFGLLPWSTGARAGLAWAPDWATATTLIRGFLHAPALRGLAGPAEAA
jgi:hypothetical protein